MSYDKLPYVVINRWVLDDLEEQSLMSRTISYQGREYSSLMPGREIPEVVNATDAAFRQKPFITYSVDNDEMQTNGYKTKESITYVIWGPSVEVVSGIAYCIKDLTSREDWSIFDLNQFINSDALTTKKFHFMQMCFEQISGPKPIKQESGRHAMIVSISYDYAPNGEWAPFTKGQGRWS